MLDESCIIQILSAPFFIATKLEAFKGRGNNDGRTSQDFEDIIYILENREKIWNELGATENELRKYLKNEFQILISNPYIFEWIECHVERGSPPVTNEILNRIKNFIEN